MTKWEYYWTEDVDSLSALGRECWELVGTAVSGGKTTFYLKRPCSSIRDQITLEQRRRFLEGEST